MHNHFSVGTRISRSRLLPILAALLFIAGCRDGDAPDVSDVKVVLNSRRFDRAIATMDTTHIGAGLQALRSRYPDFLDFWLDELMQFGVNGNYSDSARGVREHLHLFLTYKDFRGLFDTVAKHFPDTKSIDGPLQKGFQYYQHYYPARAVPRIVYFVSGLNNWRAITIDTTLVGIGLDMFLGPEYPFYRSVEIPDYISRTFRPETAPVAVFRAMYENDYPFVAEGKTLLDMMVQRGKEQYFLSKMIPFLPDSTRLGYTAAQTKWAYDNEALIYNAFAKQSMLYETNWTKILRYVNEAPESTGFPPECPGNIGTFTGLQIVKAYMAKHPKTGMNALFAQTDAQAILQEGGYKPR